LTDTIINHTSSYMYQIMVLLVILVDLDALLLGARFSLFFKQKLRELQMFKVSIQFLGPRGVGL